MNYAPTTWESLPLLTDATAARVAFDPRTGRSLLSESDRQALPDLVSRLILRAADDGGEVFTLEVPPPEYCARVVGSAKRAVGLAMRGKDGRSIVSQAYGRASARLGDPVTVDPTAPDPFSPREIREEARAVLASLSTRARAVLRVQRGEAARPADIPDRTWRRWTASAVAEASDRIEDRRR
jgi:hypothetical protein